MAISLANKTNVTAPNGTYPYGDIIDDTGTGNGTPVSRETYADFHQWFARLLDQAGITANDLPDNATNTYQYFEAFLKMIALGAPGNVGGIWINNTPVVFTTDTGTAAFFGSDSASRHKIIGKTCIWNVSGALTITGSPTRITVPLPTGVVPKSGADNYTPGYYSGSGNLPFKMTVKIGSGGASMFRDPAATFTAASGIPFSFTAIFEIV